MTRPRPHMPAGCAQVRRRQGGRQDKQAVPRRNLSIDAVLEQVPIGVLGLVLPEGGLEQSVAALADTVSADDGRDLANVGKR